MSAYEDRVLALLSEHGGSIVQRAIINSRRGWGPRRCSCADLASQDVVDKYPSDPRRPTLTDERDRVIARTKLFPVELAWQRVSNGMARRFASPSGTRSSTWPAHGLINFRVAVDPRG